MPRSPSDLHPRTPTCTWFYINTERWKPWETNIGILGRDIQVKAKWVQRTLAMDALGRANIWEAGWGQPGHRGGNMQEVQLEQRASARSSSQSPPQQGCMGPQRRGLEPLPWPPHRWPHFSHHLLWLIGLAWAHWLSFLHPWSPLHVHLRDPYAVIFKDNSYLASLGSCCQYF